MGDCCNFRFKYRILNIIYIYIYIIIFINNLFRVRSEDKVDSMDLQFVHDQFMAWTLRTFGTYK